MRKITSRSSSLFLLELMISIAFFAIAATGCVQVFAKAYILSMQAEKLDQAVSIAQSLVEKNSGGTAESRLWYYDDQGNGCDVEKAVYQAEVKVQTRDQMRQIQVMVTVGEGREKVTNGVTDNRGVLQKTQICHLETAVYCPGETDTQTGSVNE